MPFLTVLLSVIVTAAGFAVLHYALSHKTIELRLAGWTLVIGGLLTVAGIFYFPPAPPMPGMMHSKVFGDWRHKKECKRAEGAGEKMLLEAPPPPSDEPAAKP